jgi:hypothetical protein
MFTRILTLFYFCLFSTFLFAQNFVHSYEADRLNCETTKARILPDGNILFFVNCYNDDFFHEPYGFYEVRTPEDELLFRKNITPSVHNDIFITEDNTVYFIIKEYGCSFSSLILIRKMTDDYDFEGIAFAPIFNDEVFNSGILLSGNIWVMGNQLEVFDEEGEEVFQFYPSSFNKICLLTDSLIVGLTFDDALVLRNIVNAEIVPILENIPTDITEIKAVSELDRAFLIKTPTVLQLYKNTELVSEITYNITDDFTYRIDEGESVLFSVDIGESQRRISRMDLEGNITEEAILEVPVGSKFLDFDINENMIVAAESEIIAPETPYGGQTTALRQVKNLSSDDSFSTHDIGVTEIVLQDPFPVSEINEGGFPGGWEYKFRTMTVTVQNFGNSAVNSFQIRSFTPKPFSYCDGKQFITEDIELVEPLLSGTSMDFEIEDKYLTFQTMSGAEFCIWTAAPNSETDENSINDTYCTFINDTVLPNENIILDENTVRLFPNPTLDILTIETFNEFDKYRILNQTGQIVKEGDFPNDKSISTLDFPKGIYFLNLSGEAGISMQKFVRL